jgi:hypothetical protein
MNKVKLIYLENEYPNFIHGCVRKIVDQFYDLVPYDPATSYMPQDSAVLTTHTSVLESTPRWYEPLLAQGLKMIVDHLWDSDVDTPSVVKNGHLILRNGNWVWVRECIWWTDLEYNKYVPNRQYEYSFFMPMNKTREHKDLVIERLSPVLDNALYSYVERNILLKGDCKHEPIPGQVFWEFYFNPWWYDSTVFSVVVESYMRTDPWSRNPVVPNFKTEVSEKIFKPLAFKHPFITFGSYETLKYLKQQGFETFDNLWDESYDNIASDDDRHQKVSEIVINATKLYTTSTQLDRITEQKLEHNSQTFYNIPKVTNIFVNEIIGDIQRFLAL